MYYLQFIQLTSSDYNKYSNQNFRMGTSYLYISQLNMQFIVHSILLNE